MFVDRIICSTEAFNKYAEKAEEYLLEAEVTGESPKDAEFFRKVTKAFFNDCRALRRFYEWAKDARFIEHHQPQEGGAE